MTKKWFRGLAVMSAVALGLTACGSGGGQPNDAGGQTNDAGGQASEAVDATILTNWFAQAEQGGYWAAKAEGLMEGTGVNLTVRQGGPGIQTIPQVAAGEAEFGVGNADEILTAVSNGLPIVAVAAGPAKNLQCLAYHESTGIEKFSDLNGHTVARVPSPYWDYIQQEFNLDNVKAINIGSLASFKNDENLVQQCFITSEPYTIKKMGMEDVGYLMVGEDGGYNAYQNMLFTTKQFLNEHPDAVEAVVDGSIKGWSAMLEDPTATKKLITKVNSDMDPGVFDYAVNFFKENPSYLGGDDIGTISDDRFRNLKDKLVQIGLLEEDFDYTKAFTTKYSND